MAIHSPSGRRLGRESIDGVTVLYGGSVKSDNVANFLRQEHLKGVLVGGASLDPEEFAKIVQQSISTL